MNSSQSATSLPGRIFAALLVISVAISAQRTAGRGKCGAVGGLPSIGVSANDGVSWATSNRPMRLGEGTFGMCAVSGSSQLLTEFAGQIYTSTNDGCAWRRLGAIKGSPVKLVGSSVGAYAWTFFASGQIWRIDLSAQRSERLVISTKIPEKVISVGVDSRDPMHVRVIGERGGLFDSPDGGASWTALGAGVPLPTAPLIYFAAFDPNDLDHICVGMIADGIATTVDGGRSWGFATGLSQTAGRKNSFNGIVSPLDSSVVWAESIDLDESSNGAPSGGKHIYRSDDGGLTFAPVVDHGNGITLVNGPPLATHPFDVDRLYWGFGTTIFGNRLTLYRYDHGTGVTTQNLDTTTPQAVVRSVLVAPGRPDRVVVGFEGR